MRKSLQPRRAFTLVELVVVMGIIALLAGLLLPMVFRSLRAGKRARFAADLQAIETGLNAYKADFGDFPRFPQAFGIAAGQPDASQARGARLLCGALLGPGPAAVDGADGPGFRLRAGGLGKTWGPYIPIDKFKVSASNGLGSLLDQDGHPILYFPAKTGNAEIRVAGAMGYCASIDPKGTNPAPPKVIPLFNLWDCEAFFTPVAPATTPTVFDLNLILGDQDKNGEINGLEQPSSQGPYLLWCAGVDGLYGITDKGYTDDVTNFDIPAGLFKN